MLTPAVAQVEDSVPFQYVPPVEYGTPIEHGPPFGYGAPIEYGPPIEYGSPVEYGPATQVESSTSSFWPLPDEGTEPWSDEKPGFRRFHFAALGSSRLRDETEYFNYYRYLEDFTFFSAAISRQRLLHPISTVPARNAWVAAFRAPASTQNWGYQPFVSSDEGFTPWYNGPFHTAAYVGYGLGVTYAKSEFDVDSNTNYKIDVSHWIAGPRLTFGRIANWNRWTINWSVFATPGVQFTEFEKERFRYSSYPGRNSVTEHTETETGFGFAAEAQIVSSFALGSRWSFDLGYQVLGITPWYLASRIPRITGDIFVPAAKAAAVGNAMIGFTCYR